MLRFHDRGWRSFRETLLLGLLGRRARHMVAGIGMSHLAAMVVRMQRIANRYSSAQVWQWLATYARASEGWHAALQRRWVLVIGV
jgi:hypothetical protein